MPEAAEQLSTESDGRQDGDFVYADVAAIAAFSRNNSMPIADKPYDPPQPPEDIEAYTQNLGSVARQYRESLRPVRQNYVTLYLRVRRKHWEPLLWQLLDRGIIKKNTLYGPENLPFWTVGTRLRIRRGFAMGVMMEAVKLRLGIIHPGLRFCLDGFFGMINYGDIFGNTSDACPWMEISDFSTADSLKLDDGDNIFISVATSGQIEKVIAHRQKRSVDVGNEKQPASDAHTELQQDEEQYIMVQD